MTDRDTLFDTLGLRWDESLSAYPLPEHTIERACFRFHKMLSEYVWDASMLEGNPFTFPEVQTLLDGITVGGRKLSDQEQVVNLADSAKHVLTVVRSRQFILNKLSFTTIHAIVARNEALEWGHFRGEGAEKSYTPDVALGRAARHTPPPTVDGAPYLNTLFAKAVHQLENAEISTFEKAAAFFLFGALQQFFFDGNKRTSRYMMNGILMSKGIDAISIPAARRADFNEKMVRFYVEKDATEMMHFLLECHPDGSKSQS